MGRKRIYATEEERKAAQKAYMKAWHEAHKEEENARRRAWHEAHREEENAKSKAYNEAHKEETAIYKKDYYKDPFWNEIHRINTRDRARMRNWSERTGFDITPYELHHIVYHADNDYADWPKDCLLLTPEEHETWHMEHPDWVATIA